MYEPTPQDIIDQTRERKKWAIPANQGLYFFLSTLVVTILALYDIVGLDLIVIFFSFNILYACTHAFSAIYDQVATLRYENAKMREQQTRTDEHLIGLIQDVLAHTKPKKTSYNPFE